MPTLDQIGEALRRADAAGNTDDARQLAQAYAQMRDAQGGQPKSLPTVTVRPTFVDELKAGAADLGRAAVMTGRNVVHGALSLPAMVNDATLVPAINAASKAIGSDYREAPSSQQLDSYMNALGIPNPQPENATERVVSGIDRGVGGLLSGVGIGSSLASTGNVAAQGVGKALTSNLGAQTAATAAGTGASEITREAGGSPLAQIGFGLAGGLTPATLGAGKQALATGTAKFIGGPSDELAALAQKALDSGIPLKASQVSPSKVGKLMDSVSGQVPFSGSQAFQDSQQAAFNRAVARTIGADADAITSDVFAAAKNKASNGFNTLWRQNNLGLTPDVLKRVVGVVNDAAALGGNDVGNAMGAVLDRLATQGASGTLPGRAFQSIDSKLGAMAAMGGEKGHYASQMQEVLRDAMQQGMPQASAAKLAELRGIWRNLKTIEPLVASENVSGDISPAKLMGRVTSGNAGKSSMASGRRGELGDLANVGQKFLKSQIPDSGTAQRVFAGKALGSIGSLGGGLAAGSLLGPAGGLATLGGAVVGSRAIQNVLKNPALVNRLIGNKTPSEINRLLMLSANPAAQSLIQGGQ